MQVVMHQGIRFTEPDNTDQSPTCKLP